MTIFAQRWFSAVAVFFATALIAASATADERIAVVESVYAHDGSRDTPPGGYEIWADEISVIWEDMLARAAAADAETPTVFPPTTGGDLSVELITAADSEAAVSAVFDDGKSSAEVTFGLIEEDGAWKIRDVWREGRDGNRQYISEMLQQIP
ncbi:hypothetical protein [Fodinicurvata sp. EGI_FJ10296]|uniref:hypothetical protein n=1 Tax=Fodinicurvata sp. EGI_FJ10296 TaxID=3231908 RepID=UPI003452E9F5